MPSKILPDTEFINKVIVLFDTTSKSFAFDETGVYELKATYREGDPGNMRTIESNILIFQVLRPEGEEKALKAYSDEFLARLIQGDGFFDVADHGYKTAIDKAIFLAQKYQKSFYTTVLRNSQLQQLHRQIKSSSIKQSEKILYDILKEQDTEGLLEEKNNQENQMLDQKAIDFFLKNVKPVNPEKDKN
jgi:hypothetical protein